MYVKLTELTPDQAARLVAVLNKRDEPQRNAIMDMLNGDSGVDQIQERLAYQATKGVYELARRFELDAGVRLLWPWRKKQTHPGRKPRLFLQTTVNEISVGINPN